VDGGSATQGSYELRISRLTVDKLGVKLYDKASAVVAELVANAYDADGENVTVELPLATLLSTTDDDGNGWVITVADDGHGMTPDEAREFFLRVGRDRRKHLNGQGPRSRKKKRPVMGRKGIGKLAPFGICRKIEVQSSGGPRTPQGYMTTHFVMDFDNIMSEDTDEPVPLDVGSLDGTYQPNRGTTIRLRDFHPKRVPDAKVFLRQMARRFAYADANFKVVIKDTRDKNPPAEMPQFQVPVMEESKIVVDHRPVITEDGQEYSVKGWLALAKEAYKDEEMAGVRIYARGKIVATTRDFEQPAGFTGEFTTRSYLVGEVHADWLDADDGEDLIRTDRQAILWESYLGQALRIWGTELIKEIGAQSRKPRRRRVSQIFLEKSDLRNRAGRRFGDDAVAETAIALGEQIGAFAAEDELEDQQYIEDLTEVILAVAPHKALIEAFQEFHRTHSGEEASIEGLVDLFSKTRIAEMASFAQITAERVRVLDELDEVFQRASDEAALQNIIARAPWLVHPEWTVITQNQSLKTFKKQFEEFWQKRHGEPVDLVIDFGPITGKRPDFVLVSVAGRLYIVEIKAADHVFNDKDFERLHNYVIAFSDFEQAYPGLMRDFSRSWQIDLVADAVKFQNPINATAFESLVKSEKVNRMSWGDFRHRARKANEMFLDAHEEAQRRAQQELAKDQAKRQAS
jgi:hypothetical protein